VITDPQGNVVATFPGQTQINLMAPVWSPDSTRVAVWDVYPGTIGVYRIDGTRETQIAMPRQGDIGRLAWMPDGSSLLVDQYEVPLDGGTPRELPFPFTEFNSWPQQYSPNGSLVAYANPHGLMVARPDGSGTRAVFGPFGPYTWTWSPNGKLIALSANPTHTWPPNELHVVDVATGSVTQVFEGERRAILWVIGFSPDGDRVLFTSSRSGLWSVGVDGSDAHQVKGSADGTWRPI